MREFSLQFPTKIVFGQGATEDISSVVSSLGKKAMLVSYGRRPYLETLFCQIESSLRREGISYVSYLSVTANPTLGEVTEAAEIAKKENVDFFIGVGGGSVMDATKAISAAVLYPHEIWRMFSSTENGPRVLPTQALPCVMIPTVAATSSELNCVSVITNPDGFKKTGMSAPCLYPYAAVIDPQLTVSVSPFQTAVGGVDALSHLMEAFVNGDPDSPVQDQLNIGLMKSILHLLPEVTKNPENVQTRSDLQWAVALAWSGLMQAGTYPKTPMHKMGHVLSAMYGTPHGVTLAIFMNGYLHYLCEKDAYQKSRMAFLGRELFDLPKTDDISDAGKETVDRLVSFFRSLKVPVSFREAGLSEEDASIITDRIIDTGADDSGCVPALTPLDADSIRAIVDSVLR